MAMFGSGARVIQSIRFKDDADTLIEIQEMFNGEEVRIDYADSEEPVLKVETLDGVLMAKEGDIILQDECNHFRIVQTDTLEGLIKTSYTRGLIK